MSRNAVPATTLPGAVVAAQWNAVLKTTNVGQPWPALVSLLSGHKKPILASPGGITFEISTVIIVKIVFPNYVFASLYL